MLALYDVPAPAKLNLFLHITGQRADGYHTLQSAFTLIDWYDTLHFERVSTGKITRSDVATRGGTLLPPHDLSTKAAALLQQHTGCERGVHITVMKAVPAEAGMGGGSSDAATTLLALNQLWGLHLTRSQLSRLGLQLGADVPFFLSGGSAWVEGIGERLTPVALPTARWVVVKPAEGLPTAKIFANPHLNRATPAAILADFLADPYRFGRNDLQPVAERLCPSVVHAINVLKAARLSPRMTGSGSAVFAPLRDEDPAPTASSLGLGSAWKVRECNSLAQHPCMRWTRAETV